VERLERLEIRDAFERQARRLADHDLARRRGGL
jgi:hypothetical protein